MQKFLLYIFYINMNTKIFIIPKIIINNVVFITEHLSKKHFIPLIKQKKKKKNIFYILKKKIQKLFSYKYTVTHLYNQNNSKKILEKTTYNYSLSKNDFYQNLSVILSFLQFLVINIKKFINIKFFPVYTQHLRYYKSNIIDNKRETYISIYQNQFVLTIPLLYIKNPIKISAAKYNNIVHNKKIQQVNNKYIRNKHISLEGGDDKNILKKIKQTQIKKNNCDGCPMRQGKNIKTQQCISCPYNLDW
jgi:hypothetical protein